MAFMFVIAAKDSYKYNKTFGRQLSILTVYRHQEYQLFPLSDLLPLYYGSYIHSDMIGDIIHLSLVFPPKLEQFRITSTHCKSYAQLVITGD